ncbi:7310_t:CDS:2 [Diversispora eburnea]|uniref:7310_t:CDS:1 n=1 Tax=Diversispora eburnea TaxID=1213867 RepID=A0A9N9FEX2_9GLOM|nr:7310_t:CDS:2 [Diversispora eburnea]
MSLSVSRLPSRLPTFNTNHTTNNDASNETLAGQRTLPISKLQRSSSMSTKLKPPSAGIKNLPPSSPTSPTSPTKNPVATTKNHNSAEQQTSPIHSPVLHTRLRQPLKLNNDSTTRKNDDNFSQFGRNVRVAPLVPNSKNGKKTTIAISNKSSGLSGTRSSLTKRNLFNRKKNLTLNSRPHNSSSQIEMEELRSENSKLREELEKLRDEKTKILAENEQLQSEKRGLIQEKGVLTVDVCQMEYRLACEESRVIKLEECFVDLNKQCSLLNREQNQLDRDRAHFQGELETANTFIVDQSNTVTDQQSLIEELMTQLDEQEKICQDLQNVIDTFKNPNLSENDES